MSGFPAILTDPSGIPVTAPSGNGDGFGGLIGRPGLPARRLVAALPCAGGPVWLSPGLAVVDASGGALGDPGGGLVGRAPVIVNRMVAAARADGIRGL